MFTQNIKLYAVLNKESIICFMCLRRIENLHSAEQRKDNMLFVFTHRIENILSAEQSKHIELFCVYAE